MTKVVIESRGIVVKPGSGLEIQQAETAASDAGQSVLAITSNTTFTKGGVYTLSASTGTPLTGTLPNPSTIPGAEFVFRVLSGGEFHSLTGSWGATNNFAKSPALPRLAQGSGGRMEIDNVVGSSVVLKSDGLQYVLMGSSGSVGILNK